MSELVKVELVGALRYGYKGEKFERNVHYLIRADRAKLLLRLTTDQGWHIFREVGKVFQPAAPVAPRVERALPVVDTSKTEAERHDEALTASVAEKVEEAKPVVDMSGVDREPDISEEEALAALQGQALHGPPVVSLTRSLPS